VVCEGGSSAALGVIYGMQCVVLCCSVLQCVAVFCVGGSSTALIVIYGMQCVAVCCSVSQCVAMSDV